MVSSENLVFDSRAKPSRNNHTFSGTYCIIDTYKHTEILKLRAVYIPRKAFSQHVSARLHGDQL